MRYAVISDIHGNFAALQTVLHAAEPYDRVICLGDVVGYGPDPNECVECVREVAHVQIAGNHDWGATGRVELVIFNQDARQALLWTREVLSAENRDFLAALPASQRMGAFLLVHGSPREPIWEYVVDGRTAMRNFRSVDFQIALIGHSHVPLMFEWIEEVHQAHLLLPNWEAPVELEGRRLMINPGSVGQPRDGDPRASFGILDTEAMTFEFRRVSYPVEITQERMRARGLPQRLIDRLGVGR